MVTDSMQILSNQLDLSVRQFNGSSHNLTEEGKKQDKLEGKQSGLDLVQLEMGMDMVGIRSRKRKMRKGSKHIHPVFVRW
jgi:hypothetical protein